MTGFEYQVAAHIIWQGMVQEGLAITRMIHDRYHASRRNPFNDVECSDHYARAMSSYGIFVAACGFTYHGPRGEIGFAPRLSPEDFRAGFTAAEGWGTFTQRREGPTWHATLSVAWGKLRLRTLNLDLPGDQPGPAVGGPIVARGARRVVPPRRAGGDPPPADRREARAEAAGLRAGVGSGLAFGITRWPGARQAREDPRSQGRTLAARPINP